MDYLLSSTISSAGAEWCRHGRVHHSPCDTGCVIRECALSENSLSNTWSIVEKACLCAEDGVIELLQYPPRAMI